MLPQATLCTRHLLWWSYSLIWGASQILGISSRRVFVASAYHMIAQFAGQLVQLQELAAAAAGAWPLPALPGLPHYVAACPAHAAGEIVSNSSAIDIAKSAVSDDHARNQLA